MTSTMSPPELPGITLRSPADLVAATPYLLGFHPTDSLVVVAFQGKRLLFAARGDLPDPQTSPEEVATSLLEVVVRQQADAVALLGYGSPAAVTGLLTLLRDAADRRDLLVKDALLVHDGRWWSILCEDPSCCPPDGTPVNLTASEVSAGLTFAGLAAAPSRQDRARELASVAGPAREAMDRATGRAEHRLTALLTEAPADQWPETVLTAGTAAVRAALDRYRADQPLDDDALAWLGLLLGATPVRDAAWQSITSEQPHLRLWTDLTRRVDPALVAAPACLLAVTAWRGGDGLLARLALERALEQQPTYRLAHLLMEILQRGEPPVPFPDPSRPPERPGQAARDRPGQA